MTVHRYHPAFATLHWLIALLVIVALAMGAVVLANTPNTPEKLFGLRAHMITGITILVLMLVRIVMRFRSARPAPATTGNAALDRLGGVVHFLLYLGVLGMAGSGIAMSIQANLGEIVFGGVGSLPADFWVYTPRKAHWFFSRLLMALAALHIAGAMYHALIRKDGLLARMGYRGPR